MSGCKIHNNSNLEVDSEIHSLVDFTQNRLGFQNPPTIFLDHDEDNSQKNLAKTGYYDPETMEIHIYVTGRHPKDILRSIAHELVHHFQNEKGELTDAGYSGKGYAQKNPHLRRMELQANDPMLFRDWEDSLKENQPTIYNEWRNKNMSVKQWKNKELNKLLLEKFGIQKKDVEESLIPSEYHPHNTPDRKIHMKKFRDAAGGEYKTEKEPTSAQNTMSGYWDAPEKGIQLKPKVSKVDRVDPTMEENEELDEMCGDVPPEEDMGSIGATEDIAGLASRAMSAIHDLAIAAGADMATTVATGEEAEEMDVPVSHIHEEEIAMEETTKEWKNKELSENLSKKWGFKMNLNNFSKEK